MTITKNQDCTTITISDELLQDFALAENNISAVNLEYTNASGVLTTYAITEDDVTNDSISITPSFLGYTTTKIPDGVYCFKLDFTQDTDEIIKRNSIVIDCALRCKLAVYMWNSPESQIHAKYEAINFRIACDSCDCTTATLLYNDLVSILDGTTLNDDCGC